VPLLRKGTFDAAIWHSVAVDYAAVPERFTPDAVVLDVGCHTGAFCSLVARRGARVIGYEASRANYGLACLNTAGLPAVTIRWGAVWRSDRPPGRLRFVPFPDPLNTGGGSVLFASAEAHRYHHALAGFTAGGTAGSTPPPLESHDVPTVALDAVLEELGRVRLLKIDVEGAEFPILATARQLERVEIITGEYHECSPAQLRHLPDEARIGPDRYDGECLRSILEARGFRVEVGAPADGHGPFTARRR
jgi:FkbM family methyltransferase